jgi:hypothetical protein
MAVLTAADAGELWNLLYQLPNQTKILAAFQVIEDFWENNKATVKANIDTALGVTTTATEAKKIALAWLIWKVKIGG